jgi:uncharacterized protein YodC (DUF2158 family)
LKFNDKSKDMAKFLKGDEVKFIKGCEVHNYKMYINGYVDPSSQEVYCLWYEENGKPHIKRFDEDILEKVTKSLD